MSFRKIAWRAPGNYDVKQASDEATFENLEESLTVQSQAEDADINVLMRRYGITGKMPENPRIPTYGDFSDVKDYRSALHAIQAAQEGFMEIPAEVRARFDNDPQLFMEFCENPANGEHLVTLGLAKRREPPPVGAPPAAPAAAPPSGTPPIAPVSPSTPVIK